MSSSDANRYAEFPIASPLIEEILHQGIFIFDLTSVQQELEALFIGARQRHDELRQTDGHSFTLPSSSFVRSANGKKPRDFKAERERRRKAFAGLVTRKRRRKKASFPSEKILWKKTLSNNSFSSIDLGSPLKTSLSTPDRFWNKILDQHRTTWTNEHSKTIEDLIDFDQLLLKNLHDRTFLEEYREKVRSKEFLLSAKDYVHPELQHSIVLKQNEHFHRQIERISKKFSPSHLQQRGKGKISPIEIDPNIVSMLRRDERRFSSKFDELQHRLTESIRLERFALTQAEEESRQDSLRSQMTQIEEKILEITNSIRQRKRPSENLLAQGNQLVLPSNGTQTENETWRKRRRQSTLRLYDHLAHLIAEQIDLMKKSTDQSQ